MSFWIGLPKSVRIGPFDIKLNIKEFDDPDTWGMFVWGAMTIQLAPDQPTAIFAADTLWHEFYHAISKIYGLAQGDTEERIASVTSPAWIQLFRDNPGLLPWVWKSLKK